MRNLLPAGLVACMLYVTSFAQAPNHVVISQVYGGGGNAGAPFRNDFVELYNPTAAPVSLAGWSLQYAAIDGANWNANRVSLSGTIAPGKYFLVQLGSGGNAGALLPTPNLVPPGNEQVNMAAGGGKIALVSSTSHLSGACPLGAATIIDFIGWGSSASLNCFEGNVGGGPITSSATAVFRRNNGCADINDNRADLLELAPSPRNSSAQAHSCGTEITVQNISPLPLCVNAAGGTTATVQYNISGNLPATLQVLLSTAGGSFVPAAPVGTAAVTLNAGSVNITIPANLASATTYRLRIDGDNAYGVVSAPFEIINGARNASSVNAFPDQTEASVQWTPPAGCFDEFMVVALQGSGITAQPSGNGNSYMADPNFTGNGTAFGGGKVVYKGTAANALVTGLSLGVTYFFKVFTRRGTDWSSGVEASTTTRVIPAPGEVLINGFSPRYLNASDEYYELVNTTGKTFNLADLSLQYQSPLNGGGRVPLFLANILQPHSYWLLTPLASAVSVGKTPTLQGDFTSGSGISDGGYIALVRRKDNVVIDAVGYGNASGGTFFEGSLAPAIPGQVGAYRRKVDGVDNNNNATDFEVIATADIDLRNSSSRLANAGAAIAGGNYRRLYVTGNSSLQGNINLSEKVVLVNGRLQLEQQSLQTPLAEGGGINSYIQTNGAGVLLANTIGTASFVFPVGNSTYNPLIIGQGNNQQWSVRVADGVAAVGRENAVLRTWHITPSGPVAGASLTFQYNEGDPAQLGSSFTAADRIQVWTFHSGSWIKAGDPVAAAGNPGQVRTVTLSSWNQFSPFVLASAAAVLPVRFGDMRLYAREENPVLVFTVFGEADMSRYEIEWSGDGLNFTTIGSLAALNRSGTEQYTYNDRRGWSGMGFYRVKGIENTGRLFFGPVLAWTGRVLTQGLRVYPNPLVGGPLHYYLGDLPPGTYLLQVTDAGGRRVWAQMLRHNGGAATGVVPLPPTAKGWQVLEVQGAAGRWRQPFLAR